MGTRKKFSREFEFESVRIGKDRKKDHAQLGVD
jgi:hypothetical protein